MQQNNTDYTSLAQEILRERNESKNTTALARQILVESGRVKPVELDKKPGLGYVAGETLKGAWKDLKPGLVETAGVVEAPYALATGMIGFLGGLGSAGSQIAGDLMATGKPSLPKAENAMNEFMTFMAYEPKTQLGQTLTQVGAAPFTQYLEGVNWTAKKLAPNNPNTQSAIRLGGQLATLLIPKFGAKIFAKIKAGKGATGADIKAAFSDSFSELSKEMNPRQMQTIKEVVDRIPDTDKVVEPKNIYSKMPEERVMADAKKGVKLAQKELVERRKKAPAETKSTKPIERRRMPREEQTLKSLREDEQKLLRDLDYIKNNKELMWQDKLDAMKERGEAVAEFPANAEQLQKMFRYDAEARLNAVRGKIRELKSQQEKIPEGYREMKPTELFQEPKEAGARKPLTMSEQEMKDAYSSGTVLDLNVDNLYNEVLEEYKTKQQRGFVRIKDPPSIETKLPDPGVEKVLSTSKLAQGNIGRIKASFQNIKDAFNETFVNLYRLKDLPKARDSIRKFREVPFDALEHANKKILATIGKLSPQEFEVFRKTIGLKHLENELQSGRNIPGELSLNQVQSSLSHLQSQSTNKVIDAVNKHLAFVKQEGMDLVSRGKLSEESLKEVYYPVHVLDYTPSWSYDPRIPKRIRKPFAEYTKQRKGTKKAVDFDYVSAMKKHYSQVYLDNAIDDFMVQMSERYDITNQLPKEQVKTILPQGRPEPGKIYSINGKDYKGFQYQPGNAFYPAETVNNSLWQRALAEGWSVAEFSEAVGPRGGASLRETLALGGKHKTYLLPQELAVQLERFKTPKEYIPGFQFLHKATTTWKRVTLDFAGLTFQMGNLFGDALNLYKTDPGAFTKASEAFGILKRYFYTPDKLTKADMKVINQLKEQRVLTTHMFREAGITGVEPKLIRQYQRNYNPANYIGELFHQIERGSILREETLRGAKFIKDMERIAKGKNVVLGEFTKEVRGLEQSDAAGYVARNFTVDYGDVPQAYNRFLRGTLTPFLTFYDYNARHWYKYVTRRPGNFMLKFGLPTMAMFTWNNTGERKAIERNLPDWIKWLPHVNTGFTKKDGSPIVIAMNTPLDMAARWVGLDRLPAKLTAIANKDMTIQEAAIQQLKDTGLAAPRQLISLLNPMIQTIAGILTNRDTFTGNTIVPERFQGTKYEKRMLGEYVLGNFITPVSQYSRLKYDIEYTPELGTWGAWLFTGPLDIQSALGIRDVDLQSARFAPGYEKRQELSQGIKNKLAKLEMTWIKANTMPKDKNPEAFWNTQRQRIFAQPGDNPSETQVLNRLIHARTQRQIVTKLIQKTKDPEIRKDLKDYLKTLRNYAFAEDMTTSTLQAIRPTLWKFLLEESQK